MPQTAPEPLIRFVIGGVQKGGTSALARYLGTHPQLQLPRGKEAHSLWVQNAAELGIPGVALLLAFYLCTARRLWKLCKETTWVPDPWFRDAARMVVTSLVGFIVSAQFVSLEALPLTPNRKLDPRALPVPDATAFANRTHEAAKGATEIALAQIWQRLLKVDAVGRHDHFFELGGHSLLAVSLIERLRQQNLVADVRTVFTSPTLRDMAQAIDRETRDVFQAPANLIPADCTALTPDLLPLVELEQAHIDRIVASTPGGAANIQDI